MAGLLPMKLDTITTRFLSLFIFLLAIPMATLIIFTASLLASHINEFTDNQLEFSQNLFQTGLTGLHTELALLEPQIVQNPKTSAGFACPSLPQLFCLVVDEAGQRAWTSSGQSEKLSRLKMAHPDLALIQPSWMEREYLARFHQQLYLVRARPNLKNSGKTVLYGLPLSNSFLNRIYRVQRNLPIQSWIVEDSAEHRALSLLANSDTTIANLPRQKLLTVLAATNPSLEKTFEVELNRQPYKILQAPLYSFDNRQIARIVHIFPTSQNRLVLNNYYLGIYFISVASLIFSVMLAMLAARVITQPLLKLIRQVNTLSRENIMKESDQVVISGVHEIRQLGESFNRMVSRLRQEHKMKDEFVATLTHDLKVPLLAEKQTLIYLSNETYGPVNSEQGEVLEILRSTNLSSLALVNGLLEVYRYASGEVSLILEPFNLANLLQQVVLELQSLCQEKMIQLQVNCELDINSDEGVVYADPLEIKRVLHNLISNAITNTSVHGKIECRITDATHYGNDVLYKVSSFQYTTLKHPVNLSERLLVVITDSGIGFFHEDLPHLFKQFAASKGRNPMSSGLGLFNCHQVIETHNGVLWVESTEGEGSAVSFVLPVNRQAAPNRRVLRDRRKLL